MLVNVYLERAGFKVCVSYKIGVVRLLIQSHILLERSKAAIGNIISNQHGNTANFHNCEG